MTNFKDMLAKLGGSRRFSLVACGIIAALILVAYANTFTASFHFDDNPAIIENAAIRHVTWDNILQLLSGSRPVVFLSIMLNYQLNGLDVIGWHAFNIGVHIVNSIFVYFFILWTLTLPSGGRSAETARWSALFGALLYGVHPIQTESVTYIISRTELLATCFYLAAFLFFIRGGAQGKPLSVIGLVLSSLFSMGSKEWAVTLPALLLVYDFLFFSEGKMKPILARWYVYILAALPSLIIFKNLDLTSRGGTAGVGFNLVSATGITPATYFLTSLNVLWTYLRLMVLPINQNLDYDYHVAKTLFEFPTLLSFAGHLAVVAAAVYLWKDRRWRPAAFGAAWFYIGLSPVQSVVPVVDVIFEHRMYMPSVGVLLAFLVMYEALFDWIERRKATPRPA